MYMKILKSIVAAAVTALASCSSAQQPASHPLEAMGPEAGLAHLAKEIDRMRLELRAGMRERTGGRYPAPGAGDVAMAQSRVEGNRAAEVDEQVSR